MNIIKKQAGYIYLIQEWEFILKNENIYKIGKTVQEINNKNWKTSITLLKSVLTNTLHNNILIYL